MTEITLLPRVHFLLVNGKTTLYNNNDNNGVLVDMSLERSNGDKSYMDVNYIALQGQVRDRGV